MSDKEIRQLDEILDKLVKHNSVISINNFQDENGNYGGFIKREDGENYFKNLLAIFENKGIAYVDLIFLELKPNGANHITFKNNGGFSNHFSDLKKKAEISTAELEKEIEMQDKGKYNINVSGEGANNTFVIESSNVRIENKPEFKNRIDNIIAVLKSDNSINNKLKQQAISDFQNVKKEISENGKLPEKIMKGILQYGSQISSIGSLVLQLLGG